MVVRSWVGKKVLVTGAAGFLGGHAAARVRQLGAETFGLVRRSPGDIDGIHWLSGDLSDPKTALALVGRVRPDVVLHLAGQTIAAPEKDLVLPSFRNNLMSTVNVLLALTEVGCQRVVVTGSLEEPKSEAGGLVPASPYGASKWAEVVYARMFHALYRLPVTVVRPFITYGPRQRSDKLVPSLVLTLLRGEMPSVNQPDREADWIYIDDVIEGILAAGLAADADGRTIELGSGALVSIRDIAAELEKIVGGGATVRLTRADRSVGVHGRRADLEPALQVLGWRPRTSLRDGLMQTVAWYRSRLTDYPAAT